MDQLSRVRVFLKDYPRGTIDRETLATAEPLNEEDNSFLPSK